MISEFLLMGKALKDVIDTTKEAGNAAKSGDPRATKAIMEEALRKQAIVSSGGSMAKFLRRYIVEPTIYITPSASRSSEIHDIINKQLDVFTSFYSQVFQILLGSYGLHAETAITVLNTGGGDREAILKYGSEVIAKGVALTNQALSKLDYGIDGLIDDFMSSKYLSKLSKEDDDSTDFLTALKKSSSKDKNRKLKKDIRFVDEKNTIGYDFFIREIKLDLNKFGTSSENGKRFDTELSVTIPLTIKASVVTITTDELMLNFQPKHTEDSFFSRLEQYRSGRISMKEFIFCTDLIKARKEQKLKDVNNMISKLEQNVSSANSKYLTTGMVGFEKYYNMFVLTIDDVKKIKNILNMDILNVNAKEKFLSKLNGFSAMVVDQEWERVSLLIKDLGEVTSVPLKKVKSKNKNEEITDIFKQLLLGQTPRF